jgi:hypothetical protein
MNTFIEKTPIKPSPPAPKSPKPSKRWAWLLWGMVLILIYAATHLDGIPFLVERDGEYDLSPERKAKLKRELDEIDNAVQYAVLATEPGFYPCYHCQSGAIYLKVGEVWKYGSTRIGDRRYKNNELPADLFIKPEFFGEYGACLKQEKIKIYFYAILPENTVRETPLIRPPGNKVDN